MKTTLVLHTLLSLCYGLQYGPCHPVTTVDVDDKEWEAAGSMYVNLQPVEQNAHCEWMFHYLTHDDGGRVYLSYYFKQMKGESQIATTWSGERVDRGHYVSITELMVGRNSTIHTYFLYFDPPNLVCHFTCTDNPHFANVKGGLVCKSLVPDAPHAHAPVIRQVAEDNGFDLDDHMVVDNCKTVNNCSNFIPFEHGVNSNCHNITTKEYFNLS